MAIAIDRETTPLDVPTTLRHRAIESFKPDPIAPELLHQLVELTLWLRVAITQAPVMFVFAADSTAAKGFPHDLKSDTVQNFAFGGVMSQLERRAR